MEYIDDKEVMDLFPHLYEGYKVSNMAVVADEPVECYFEQVSSGQDKEFNRKMAEIDDELGLEVVQKETIEAKYCLSNLKDNDFVRSLREQFDRKGYLSEKQVRCLR